MRLVTAIACGGALVALGGTACSALIDTSVLTRGEPADSGGGGAQTTGGSAVVTHGGDGPGGSGTGGDAGAPSGGDAGSVVSGGSGGLTDGGGNQTGGSSAQGGTGDAGGSVGGAGQAGASAGSGGAPPCIVTSGADYCDGIDNDCNPATHDVCPAGCTSSVFAGHGYMACTGDQTYTAAEALCVKQHMHLVEINDAAENAFVLSFMKPLGKFVWMGGTDAWKAHTYRWPDTNLIWSDGTAAPDTYTNFGNGEPANLSVTACLQITNVSAPPPGSWTSTPCTEKQPYVCERYAPFPP